jgi:cytochrome c oxidase subunit IV
MSGHVVSTKFYVGIFLALMALTATTVGVAFADLGAFNTVVALVIAVTKMLLVILFFMHVRYSSHLTKLVILAGFFWLMILLFLTLSDFRTRDWTPDPASWLTSRTTRSRVVQPTATVPSPIPVV